MKIGDLELLDFTRNWIIKKKYTIVGAILNEEGDLELLDYTRNWIIKKKIHKELSKSFVYVIYS